MRIPASKIVTGSYTSNGDYVYKSTKNIYKGYYYSVFGKSYIGKKVLYHNKKVKLGKKEVAELTGVGRKPTTKIVTKESDWETYYGSNKEVMQLIKDGKQDLFTRTIIKLAPNKKLLTYYETQALFTYKVLEHPESFYNDNILGKFFTKDFIS